MIIYTYTWRAKREETHNPNETNPSQWEHNDIRKSPYFLEHDIKVCKMT